MSNSTVLITNDDMGEQRRIKEWCSMAGWSPTVLMEYSPSEINSTIRAKPRVTENFKDALEGLRGRCFDAWLVDIKFVNQEEGGLDLIEAYLDGNYSFHCRMIILQSKLETTERESQLIKRLESEKYTPHRIGSVQSKSAFIRSLQAFQRSLCKGSNEA